MPINQISALHQAQHTVLDLVASCSGCAIGLYESTENGEIREGLPERSFEPYCLKMQSFSEGKRLCHDDHIDRARQVIENGKGDLHLCHAGVFNQSIPIVIGGKVRAVLMYGQMWVEGDRRCLEAKERRDNVIEHLCLDEDDELELRIYFDEIKRLSRKDRSLLNKQLAFLQRFFYEKLSEALELDRYTETVVHDLQTRLQPILAHAEKLRRSLGRVAAQSSHIEPLATIADELLGSIIALRVPIWNLGEYMPQYRFEYCPLTRLVEEAAVLYKAEAERKEVEIRIDLKEPSSIRMSRVHLQQAINNLMHNAIKYSFFGRDDLDRYVKVQGETDGFDYTLIFSNYGVGILPEEFDLIFEPGYKGRLTDKEYRSGAGMGLTITREVVEEHHGTIQVGSRKTGGEAHRNTFIVRLPHIQPIKEERK